MKVLNISYSDINGGAAIAALRLNRYLNREEIESNLLVLNKNLSDDSIVLYRTSSNLLSRARRKLDGFVLKKLIRNKIEKNNSGYEIFNTHHSVYKDLHLYADNYDILNLHWISEFLDFHSFFSKIKKDIPIVWTLHDMNPFTGGCHYDNNCGKFRDQCGSCPQLNSFGKNDISHKIIRDKLKIFERYGKKINFISPSHWLNNQLQSSFLFNGSNSIVIPNGIDTNVFQPRNKMFSREILGIPKEKNVILTGSHSLNTFRKGFDIIESSFENISREDICFVSFGTGKLNLNSKYYHQLGFINDELLLSLVYSAADIFLLASVQDNLPNTVLESISCGTPVVAFETGGLKDIIEDDFNGLLIKERNPQKLNKYVYSILENNERLETMSVNARKTAVEKFDSVIQANNYSKFYKSLLQV